MRSFFKALCIIILFTSCIHKQNLQIEGHSYRFDSVYQKITYNVIIKETDNARIFIFNDSANSNEVTTYSLEQYLDVRDSVIFLNISCPLIDTKTFEINHKHIKVYKYRFDEPDGIDEELDLFVTEKNGLIALKDLAWNSYEIFISTDKTLTDQLLQDSTYFFKSNHRFKYPNGRRISYDQ